MKTVYVAGPLTKGNLYANTKAAVEAGDRLWKAGLLPFVPHAISMGEFICPKEYEDAMRYDFAWLKKCDALLRLPGDSPGADREVSCALDLGIEVFRSEENLIRWALST